MPYIIDGHNLIGAMPDIELADPHDEQQLLDRLRAYRARAGGRSLIVFFDSGDLPVYFPDPSTPGVRVRFSGRGQTADDAIVEFLRERAQPGQYAVVTNDHGLAERVRAVGASLIQASDFATRLAHRAVRQTPAAEAPALDPHAPAFADIYADFLEADKACARFGDASPANFETWIEKLYGDDLEQAQSAAFWLGHYGGAEALAPLRDALTHADARVRAAALLALGDLGDPAGLSDLCERLVSDAASMARAAAAQSLGRIGDRTVEACLEEAAQSDAKGRVRKAARAALAQVRARTSFHFAPKST